ncbi:MAG TPA: ammonium transporter [Verrucomicrobiae bacterium]|nr:ammonium transporter [Verrucomicrobiae bacterium]
MVRLSRIVVLVVLLAGLGAMASAAFAQTPATPPAAEAPKTDAAAPAAGAPAAPATPAAPKIDSGDTAWVLMSSALVLLMTAPGLALFYGGMVRQKNALGTLMHSFIILALISVQWVLWGYSLAFGPDKGGIIGGLEWVGLRGVGQTPNADYAATIPHQVFMLFQMMFAVITPALITGAFAERKKFSTFIVFILAWATLVYDPLAHWVWGVGGWLRNLGALDFAGGTVVHISSGVSALAAALVIGKRRGFGHQPMPPHNLPLTVMGAGLLWFGWFGFNAGSALSSGTSASLAFTTTFLAPMGTLVVWTFLDILRHKKATAIGAATAIVVGLVAITPAAGFISPMSAIILGGLAAVPSYYGLILRAGTKLDDSLDVVAAHGVGGTVGALLTGVFAEKAWNGTADGLLFGNPGQLGTQAIAVGAAIVYSGVLSFVLLKLVGLVTPLRASENDEGLGMDISQHNDEAYATGEGATLVHPSSADQIASHALATEVSRG